MNTVWMTILGFAIIFAATTSGAALVFFFKKDISEKTNALFLGFAAGIMIAASVWSLLIPSIEMLENIKWLLPSIGFLSGIGFLILIDIILPKINKKNKPSMLFFAVTLHNIPEGMAVGVVFAGLLSGNTGITLAGAFTLSIGIALQNFPEGAIISMPLKSNGYKKTKAFIYGVLSGIVEPIAAIITIYLTNILVPIMPFFLSFAAGAMIYVVVEELIPESKLENSSIGTIGVGIGFVIMMILDVALG